MRGQIAACRQIDLEWTYRLNHNRAMVTKAFNRWKVGGGTFALWFLAVASVVFWGLKLSAPATVSGAAALPHAQAVVDARSLARLLGGEPVESAPKEIAPTRYTLIGVLAGTRSGHGAALIEVDGKPAKPFRVGAEVTPGLVLQTVSKREARLGASLNGASSMSLQMPLKTASSSGAAAPAAPALGNMPAFPNVQAPVLPQGTGMPVVPLQPHPASGQ